MQFFFLNMNFEELKTRCTLGSKVVLTEESVLDAFVFLYTGGNIEDYPNEEDLQRVKKNFKRLTE